MKSLFKLIILICVWALGAHLSFSQSGGVSINESGNPPDASAMLDVSSAEKGILIPRMNDAARDLISSPAKGLLIYNLDEECFQANYGIPGAPDWRCMASGTFEYEWADSTGFIVAVDALTGGSADYVVITDDGKLGIGTKNPTASLHVDGNMRLTGSLYDSGNDNGTSGQILTTGGTNIDWANANSLQFGTNPDYANFESDGTLVFNGNATVYNDFIVPLFTAKMGGNPPTWVKFRDNGSGSVGIYTWAFGDVGATIENEINLAIQMPHDWKEGTAIKPHVHWSPMTNGSGAVRWGIEYTWVDYQGNFSTTVFTYGNSDAISNNQYKHMITGVGSITPTSDQNNISCLLMIRLFRNSSNAADTYTGDAAALSFDIHYEINTVGSRSEYTK